MLTPWGDSDSLRARRLRPGPGQARADVERNQRERLYGATVALVAEKGYQGTTLSDLCSLSGVSSRSFYDLFAGKQELFVEMLKAVIELAIAYAISNQALSNDSDGSRKDNDWEAAARRGFDAFIEMVVAQPATARVMLIEAYAAGPEAMAPIDAAMEGFEWLTQQTAAASPERAGMPPEMITAHIGASRELASARLRQGREQELPGLLDEMWELISSYRPPPEPLRMVGRSPAAGTESLEAHDHAERAIRAFAVVVAEKGFAATTVDEVVARAGMSATTFYDNFAGKEDILMAAIDSAGAQTIAAALPPFERTGGWPQGIRAAYGAVFNFLASRPALAELTMKEIYAAGPAAVERRVEAMRPFRTLLEQDEEGRKPVPTIAPELIAGGIATLAYRAIRDGGPEELPALAPLATYITLAPYLGATEACKLANGSGRRERPAPRDASSLIV
jgi:AcrR family transcriptional regulator